MIQNCFLPDILWPPECHEPQTIAAMSVALIPHYTTRGGVERRIECQHCATVQCGMNELETKAQPLPKSAPSSTCIFILLAGVFGHTDKY